MRPGKPYFDIGRVVVFRQGRVDDGVQLLFQLLYKCHVFTFARWLYKDNGGRVVFGKIVPAAYIQHVVFVCALHAVDNDITQLQGVSGNQFAV